MYERHITLHLNETCQLTTDENSFGYTGLPFPPEKEKNGRGGIRYGDGFTFQSFSFYNIQLKKRNVSLSLVKREKTAE
jgi:hypothetical protein